MNEKPKGLGSPDLTRSRDLADRIESTHGTRKKPTRRELRKIKGERRERENAAIIEASKPPAPVPTNTKDIIISPRP